VQPYVRHEGGSGHQHTGFEEQKGELEACACDGNETKEPVWG